MQKNLMRSLLLFATLFLGIAVSAQTTGTLYFSSGASNTQLYRVDNPGTASVAVTAIGSPYTTIYNGIGYYNGLLYGITFGGQVISVNPNTGAVTALGISLPAGANYASGDIANGILYTSNIDGGASNHNLYRVNISNGTYTSVPLAGQFPDFVYYNGYLYGAAGLQGSMYIYRIDPSSGAMVQVGGNIEMGPGAAAWTDGSGMIYFDRKGTFNVNTGVATTDASVGTTMSGVAGSGSGYDDATLAPAASTPLTNGGTVAADQTGCGTFDPAAFTSTAPASGGTGSGAIQYRWWANGALITGATSATYDPGPITATTTYQREANRVGTTGWVASNVVTVTITACGTPLTNGGTIAADQTGCGTFDPAAFTSTAPASGGTGSGAIQYRWWANGALINGATSATYDPGPITATTTYQREANRVGTTGWVASNVVTVTITACGTPLTNGGTIAADQTGCGTFDPAAFTSTAPGSGGSGPGAIQYRWWANGALINGATSATYDPGPITATTTYQREANRVGTTGWVASNVVTVTITACGTPLTNGGTIAADQTGCGTFDPAAFTSTAPGSGGTGPGAIQYRWWANGALITGATSDTYDPGPITATTTYQREANRVGTPDWVGSNTVTVTITACNGDLIDGGTIGYNQANCGAFDPATLVSLTPASGGNGTGAIQYRWLANGVQITGATNATYDPGMITANTIYQRQANRVGTTTWVNSNTVTAAVDSCSSNIDFDVTLDQNGSSVIPVGSSLPITVYITNLTATAGPCSFTLSKPTPASGLNMTIGTLPPGWTMTTTATQYIFTSNGTNIEAYGSVSLPVTVNRTGGTPGAFTFNANITATNDTNPANNNAIIVITKL